MSQHFHEPDHDRGRADPESNRADHTPAAAVDDAHLSSILIVELHDADLVPRVDRVVAESDEFGQPVDVVRAALEAYLADGRPIE